MFNKPHYMYRSLSLISEFLSHRNCGLMFGLHFRLNLKVLRKREAESYIVKPRFPHL